MASTFDKYSKRGAYHWRQIERNIFWFNAYVAARYRQVVKLVGNRGGRILDVGCGDGVLLSLLPRGKFYGVDLDKSSLEYAASKIKGKFIVAPAEKLPFKANFFDTVIATEIIEHLADPERLLTQINRALKPGGKVIITTPVSQPKGLTDKLHVYEFSPQELKELCRRHFRRVASVTSHPVWLKKFYCWSWGRLGRYHLDVPRWLINGGALLFGANLFLFMPGRPSQQLVIGYK